MRLSKKAIALFLTAVLFCCSWAGLSIQADGPGQPGWLYETAADLPYETETDLPYETETDLPDQPGWLYETAADGSVCITGRTTAGKTLEIPAQLDGKPVTAIGLYAFQDDTTITALYLPESVTNIGAYAFSGCTALATITGAEYLQQVGWGSFGNTAWYASQPEGPVYLGNILYRYKGTVPEQTVLTVREGTVSVAPVALVGQTGLVQLDLPDSVRIIGREAFSNCAGLTAIRLSGSLTQIGPQAFARTAVTAVELPQSLQEVDGGAFDYCEYLEDISFPDTLVEYAPSAFTRTPWYDNQPAGALYAGSALLTYKGVLPENTDFIVREGTLSISAGFLAQQEGLRSVSIPASVQRIGQWAFTGCKNLQQISVDAASTAYASPDSLLLDLTNHTLLVCPQQKTGAVTVPDGVETIADTAFQNCQGITAVTLPDGLQTIGAEGFQNCQGITAVTLPDGLQTIGAEGFAGCVGLTGLDIPDTVTWIGGSAFKDCTALRSVTLSAGLTAIERETFANCVALQDVAVPDGLQSIRADAFFDCVGLKRIVLPASVTEIQQQAFYGVGPEVYLESPLDLVICAPAGSYAQTYAQENGFAFEPLEISDDGVTGDVTGDGYINNKDFARLKAYLADDQTVLVQACADTTGDGYINNKDLARLKAYLADDEISLG